MSLRPRQHWLGVVLCCTPVLLSAHAATSALSIAAPEAPLRIDPVPLPSLQSTAQWEPLAQQLVQHLWPHLLRDGVTPRTSLYVAPPVAASAFEMALHALVQEQLVRSGVKVLNQPDHARLQLSLQARLLAPAASGYALPPAAPSNDVLLTSQVARGQRVISSYSQLLSLSEPTTPWFVTPRAPTMYPVSVWKVTNQ